MHDDYLIDLIAIIPTEPTYRPIAYHPHADYFGFATDYQIFMADAFGGAYLDMSDKHITYVRS